MLGDVCSAVETTIEWEVGDNPGWARRVIERFPAVRENCDHLGFSDPAQALAYLILHLPDRYCRMFQVLERMLASGAFPIGKRDDFAAIDIGAGPGPGIFAVRNFYAALACYTRLHDPAWRVTPLGRADIVEYSQAMPRVMGRFGQALLKAERDQLSGAGTGPAAPHPCAEELARSALPPSHRAPDIGDRLCSAGVVFDLVAQDEAGAGVPGLGGVELGAEGGDGAGVAAC